MAGWTGKRVNVAFSKPEEPAFLKRFKERVGYKEDHGISDKFAAMPEATDEDLEDKDDELPQVVSLKSGDLSQEEYDRLRSEGKLDQLLKDGECQGVVEGPKPRDEEKVPADGKILFRKPTKRSGDDKDGQGSEKKQKGDGKSEKKDKKQKKKEQQKIKLLSFNEDEEEEEG